MTTPHISMSLSAHYVTSASTYDRLLLGKKLTDRRIKQLQKEGYFGGEKSEARKKKIKRARTFKELMKDFGL